MNNQKHQLNADGRVETMEKIQPEVNREPILAPDKQINQSQNNDTSMIEVFNNSAFGELTVLAGNDGQPWFFAQDIASMLGYQNTRDAISKHVDDEGKGVANRDTNNKGIRKLTTINESGLYALIFSSKLKSAKTFKRWVTKDVLPSIREHGTYGHTLPKDYPKALEQLAQQHRNMQQQAIYIEQTKDDVAFSQAVSSSKSGVNLEVYSKSVGIGRNKLFAWLRRERILMSDSISKYSKSHNMPYQQYIDAKYFTIKRNVFKTSHGRERTFTPLITGKGEKWLTKKLIRAELINGAGMSVFDHNSETESSNQLTSSELAKIHQQ